MSFRNAFNWAGALGLGIATLASPASAAIYTTTPQVGTVTGTYTTTGVVSTASTGTGSFVSTGTNASSMWTYTFSFAPFVNTTTTTLNGVHIKLVGTDSWTNATISCGLNITCTGSAYSLNSAFTVTPTGATAFGAGATLGGPVSLVQSGGAWSVGRRSSISLGAGTDNNSASPLVYYNTVTGSGGTLNAANFTGLSHVDITIQASRFTSITGTGGVIAFPAGSGGASLTEALSIEYYYDYIDTPEPASLALFSVGLGGLLLLRRRSKKV